MISSLQSNEVSESVIEVDSKQSQYFPHLDQADQRQVLQNRWQSLVSAALEPVSSFDPTIRDFPEARPETMLYFDIQDNLKELETAPDELSATKALDHKSGELGVDIRPHLHDGKSGWDLLCDSGSQITAWPPDEGDQPLPGTFLRAVNGSKLRCYGYKQVSIQIGRKQFHYQAIKADVQSPVIGWDFFKHYRIDFRWNRWGDVVLFDKKSKISQVLKFKSVPFLASVQASSLRLSAPHQISKVDTPTTTPCDQTQVDSEITESEIFSQIFQIASMQELGESNNEENANSVPEGPYQDLIKKFPELLKPNFKTETPKNKISHRIHTGSHPPCRAKARPLLPDSPKAVEGKKAWQQLKQL